MRKLDARLQAIADLVRGGIIADIGSDHALLPARLVKTGKIKKAYAIDISAKCVERMKNNLADFNIPQEIIEPVLSDGLTALENIKNINLNSLTDIIIAGMGGETIAHIIADIKKPENINFILQPNTKKDFLKDFLTANNFDILQELTVRDKKRFYNIISAILKI